MGCMYSEQVCKCLGGYCEVQTEQVWTYLGDEYGSQRTPVCWGVSRLGPSMETDWQTHMIAIINYATPKWNFWPPPQVLNPFWSILTRNCSCPSTVADPGFPRVGGAKLPWGAPTYDLPKVPKKPHEIERIWAPKGRGGAPMLNPADQGFTGVYWKAAKQV